MTNAKWDKLYTDLRTEFGEDTIMRAVDIPKRPGIPSGSLALDFAVGFGGMPQDRVIEISGKESSGKTTLALMIMTHFLDAQTDPSRGALVLDLEHKLTADWLEYLVGSDRMERIIYIQPDHAEQATNIYKTAVRSGQVCFALYDSIAGAPTKRRNDDAEVAGYGGNAGAITEFARSAANLSAKYVCLTVGINQTRDDFGGYNRLVCLAGETRVLTRRGFRPIAELAGGTHEVLTDHSVWVNAPIDCYGEDELWEVIIERYGVRKVFRANGDHRWPARRIALYRVRPPEMTPTHELTTKGSCPDKNCPLHGQCHCPLYCGIETNIPPNSSTQRAWIKGHPMMFTRGHRATITGLGHGKYGRVKLSDRQMITTKDLMVGDYLTTNTPRASGRPDGFVKWGVAWGFSFGDGTRPADKGYGSVAIHDSAPKDKDILPYFDAFSIRREDNNSRIKIYGIPRLFKELPSLDEPISLLYSWLAGYFAADGDMDSDGCAGITSGKRKHLEFVQDLCANLGIATGSIEENKYSTKSYRGEGNWYYLNFPVGALPKDFLILKSHRDNYKQSEVAKARWRVVGAKRTGVREPIYCADVPGTETFTLEDYILTGNTPGGRGWKAACILRLELVKSTREIEYAHINGEKVPVGHMIYAKVRKNQLGGIEGRTTNWWFYSVDTEELPGGHPFGIDTLDEVVRLGVATEVLQRNGGWYTHPALPANGKGEHKVQGLEAVKRLVCDDETLRMTLSSEILASLGDHADEVAPIQDPETPIELPETFPDNPRDMSPRQLDHVAQGLMENLQHEA